MAAGSLLRRIDAFGGGRGRALAHLVAVLLLIGVVYDVNRERGLRVTVPLPLGQVRQEEGKAFFAWLGLGRSDASDGPSTLELLEDGRPLGPAHTGHADVRRLGGGRFSHWYEAVLFSTSDDSDPRTNGRRYEVRLVAEATPLLALWPLALLLNLTRWGAALRRAATTRPWRLVAILLGVALVQRLIAVIALHDATVPWYLVKGVPYSDARDWEVHAQHLAEGDWRWLGDSYWRAMRPLYWLVLGAVYAWTGPAVAVAHALNVLLSLAAVGLLFEALRRVAPLPVALVASFGVALSGCDADGVVWTMSEPLGACLSTAALWALVLGATGDGATRPAPRLGWFALAGALLALSNLARPFTLVAAVTVPPALLLLRGWSRRDALLAGAAFAIAVVLTLAPWLVAQRVRHGLWSLSGNTAEILYSSTAPEHDGLWVPAVSRMVPLDVPIAERAEFYVTRARRQLAAEPAWFVRRTVRALVDGVTLEREVVARRGRLVLVCAFLLLAPPVTRRATWMVAVVAALLLPGWALLAVGVVSALVRRGPLSLFAVVHASTLVAAALLRVSHYHRLMHALEGTGAALELWGAWWLLSLAAGPAAERAAWSGVQPPSWGRTAAPLRWAAVATVAILVSGVALGASRSPAAAPIVDDALRARCVEQALAGEPWSAYRPFASRLLVVPARLRRDYVTTFAPGERFAGWGDALYAPRPYATTVATPSLEFVFPGDPSSIPDGAAVLVVGVPAVLSEAPFDRDMLEAVAIVVDGAMLRTDAASVAAHVAHISSCVAARRARAGEDRPARGR